jgi:hypothetical protein
LPITSQLEKFLSKKLFGEGIIGFPKVSQGSWEVGKGREALFAPPPLPPFPAYQAYRQAYKHIPSTKLKGKLEGKPLY